MRVRGRLKAAGARATAIARAPRRKNVAAQTIWLAPARPAPPRSRRSQPSSGARRCVERTASSVCHGLEQGSCLANKRGNRRVRAVSSRHTWCKLCQYDVDVPRAARASGAMRARSPRLLCLSARARPLEPRRRSSTQLIAAQTIRPGPSPARGTAGSSPCMSRGRSRRRAPARWRRASLRGSTDRAARSGTS